VLVLLLLASVTVIALDARGGDDSPLAPVRTALGDVVGPVETVSAATVRPFRAVPRFFRTTGGLREDVARLRSENSRLRTELAGAAVDRHRVAELDGMLATSKRTGYALVPARVVALGPAQSFSRTVTIDAGRRDGVRPDLTVVNADGLVGRVVHADATTATVLLVVDRESVVGGRLGSNMEIGTVRGRGDVGAGGRLELDLVDPAATATRNDAVVTWGSRRGGPYVAGIPVGRVTAVSASPRQQSTRAVLTPYVDFSSLDLVGVVVDPRTAGDRTLIRADGTEEAR
jgi:rod shape-determining protein MreC